MEAIQRSAQAGLLRPIGKICLAAARLWPWPVRVKLCNHRHAYVGLRSRVGRCLFMRREFDREVFTPLRGAFKLGACDSRYKLMEVNPRSWSWISLPIAMGINIPYAFLLDACNIDVPVQGMTAQRAVYISLCDDLYWSLKGRDGFPWIHCPRGYEKIVEPFFSLKDPLPGLIHFQRSGVALLGSLGKAARRKCNRAFRSKGGLAPGTIDNCAIHSRK